MYTKFLYIECVGIVNWACSLSVKNIYFLFHFRIAIITSSTIRRIIFHWMLKHTLNLLNIYQNLYGEIWLIEYTNIHSLLHVIKFARLKCFIVECCWMLLYMYQNTSYSIICDKSSSSNMLSKWSNNNSPLLFRYFVTFFYRCFIVHSELLLFITTHMKVI
jgi:hypothetical protein